MTTLYSRRTGVMKEVKQPQTGRAYINVMESLVADEVHQQLQHVPGRIRRYLKMEEVVTYALNRLPTLYASSERGWQHQRQLAKRDMNRQITSAVRQAIAAVQVDPLRLSQPLNVGQNAESEAVLQALRALFQRPELTWEQALGKLHDLQNEASSIPAQLAREPWQPGNHTDKVAWTHRRRRPQHVDDDPLRESTASPSREAVLGWDDPRYHL